MNRKTAAALAVGGGLALGLLYAKGGSGGAPAAPAARLRVPGTGLASKLRVVDVIRDDNHGVGGLSAFELEDTGADMPLADLLERKDVVLYCWARGKDVEGGGMVLLFVSVRDMGKLAQHPFLDRGVREHCGAEAFAVSIESAEAKLPAAAARVNPQKVVFVWNTGRCGSTLMHRLLSAAGAESLSEPFWLDQLSFPFMRPLLGADDAERKANATRLFQACALLDFGLAVSRAPAGWGGCLSLNPKSMMATIDDALATFPGSKHIFMYRDCAQVAESFGSIFHYHSPLATRAVSAAASAWRRLTRQYTRLGDFGPYHAARLNELAAADLDNTHGAIAFPRDAGVARRVAGWLDTMHKWVEVREAFVARSGGDAAAASEYLITVRMDEFVGKAPSVKKGGDEWAMLINVLLRFAGLVTDAPTPPPLAPEVRAVFEKDSQAGNRMAASSHKGRVPPVLVQGDHSDIAAAIAAVGRAYAGAFGSAPVTEAGSVLPGSLAVPSEPALVPTVAWGSLRRRVGRGFTLHRMG
jgi:hypothetical protein